MYSGTFWNRARRNFQQARWSERPPRRLSRRLSVDAAGLHPLPRSATKGDDDTSTARLLLWHKACDTVEKQRPPKTIRDASEEHSFTTAVKYSPSARASMPLELRWPRPLRTYATCTSAPPHCLPSYITPEQLVPYCVENVVFSSLSLFSAILLTSPLRPGTRAAENRRRLGPLLQCRKQLCCPPSPKYSSLKQWHASESVSHLRKDVRTCGQGSQKLQHAQLSP